MLKKHKNSGFSVIELLAVVVIMAILATGTITIVLSVSSYRAKQAAEEISATMSETRVQALSKTSAWMEIRQETDGTYMIGTSYAGDTRLANSYTISYTKEGDATEVPIQTSNPLVLTYDRSTGGFADIKIKDPGGNLSGTGTYCDSITVRKGSKAFVIRLYKESGKHKFED